MSALGGATLVTVLGLQALPSVGVHDVATFQVAVVPGQLSMRLAGWNDPHIVTLVLLTVVGMLYYILR